MFKGCVLTICVSFSIIAQSNSTYRCKLFDIYQNFIFNLTKERTNNVILISQIPECHYWQSQTIITLEQDEIKRESITSNVKMIMTSKIDQVFIFYGSFSFTLQILDIVYSKFRISTNCHIIICLSEDFQYIPENYAHLFIELPYTIVVHYHKIFKIQTFCCV